MQDPRTQAKAMGLIRYFTGLPCKYGHLSERYVSSNGCVECHYRRYHDEAPPPKVIKACLGCGAEFICNRRQKYCNSLCRERFAQKIHCRKYPDRVRLRHALYYDKVAAVKLSKKVCADCGISLPVLRVKYCGPCGIARRQQSRYPANRDHAWSRLICANAYNRYQSKRHARFRILRELGLLKRGDNEYLVLRAAKELGIF